MARALKFDFRFHENRIWRSKLTSDMRKTDVCVHEQNKVSFVVQADTLLQPFLAKIKLVSMYSMMRPLNLRVRNGSKKKPRALTSGRNILHFVHLVCPAGVIFGGEDLIARTLGEWIGESEESMVTSSLSPNLHPHLRILAGQLHSNSSA